MMDDEVKQYFQEKYKAAGFRVVPGHWPDFKSKKAVDLWFALMDSMRCEAVEEKDLE